MPFCKKDPKKKFTGKEPSPKGLGYCAHNEKIHTTKKGRDGNDWIIKKYGKTKRWVKILNKTVKKTLKKETKKIDKHLSNEKNIVIWEKLNLKGNFKKITSGEISLTKNGWFSMIYRKKNYVGRIHFSLTDLDQGDISIKNLKLEENKNILSFIYNGEWEDWENNKTIKVKNCYKIKFNSDTSFNTVKNIVNKYEVSIEDDIQTNEENFKKSEVCNIM